MKHSNTWSSEVSVDGARRMCDSNAAGGMKDYGGSCRAAGWLGERRKRCLITVFWLVTLAVVTLSGTGRAQAADLKPLIGNGGEITLDPGITYELEGPYTVTSTTIVHGNGATILVKQGPLTASGNNSLQLEQVSITGTGWSALAVVNGGTLIIKGSPSIDCLGGTGVYVDGSSATIEDSTIRDSAFGLNSFGVSHIALTRVDINDCTTGSFQQLQGDLDWNGGVVRQIDNCAIYLDDVTATFTSLNVIQSGPNSYAFNFGGNVDHTLHAVTVTGSRWGVLVAAGTTTIDQGSVLETGRLDGVGVASVTGARLVLRDTTIRGFFNGVDVQPFPISPGTVDIDTCAFSGQLVAAVSTVNAVNPRIVNSSIRDTTEDGIFFERSIGSLVDNCRIINSLNTGVTFLNCPGGGTVQNSLVQGSVHQGIAIVNGSANVRIIGNTVIGSVICNIFVDKSSKAFIQGNLLSGSPDFNVRLHGTRGTKLESNLIVYSQQGVEAKSGANAAFTLSVIANHNRGGIVAYGGSALSLTSTYLVSNNLKSKSSYSVFINKKAHAKLRASRVGPAGNQGLYNNAGTTSDVTATYWDAADGPTLMGDKQGSGAVLAWNPSNGSKVRYEPYMRSSPVLGDWTNKLSRPAGGRLKWKTSAGVTVLLTANPNSTSATNQLGGALRASDTSLLRSWNLPAGCIPGQVYTVWLGYGLRENNSTGSLVFSAPGTRGRVQLMRRTPTGSWASVPATWNPGSGTLTFKPTDLQTLNGTFALVQG